MKHQLLALLLGSLLLLGLPAACADTPTLSVLFFFFHRSVFCFLVSVSLIFLFFFNFFFYSGRAYFFDNLFYHFFYRLFFDRFSSRLDHCLFHTDSKESLSALFDDFVFELITGNT